MLEKRKYPHLSRAQRRHPRKLMAAATQGGVAPSALLTTMLMREGYWPDNELFDVASMIEKAREQIAKEKAERGAARPQGKSIVGRVWGKMKQLFA